MPILLASKLVFAKVFWRFKNVLQLNFKDFQGPKWMKENFKNFQGLEKDSKIQGFQDAHKLILSPTSRAWENSCPVIGDE